MKGKLEMVRTIRDNKAAVIIRVQGNVGQENRDKLDALGMMPETDISNCRMRIVSDPIELGTLRDALISQEIVEIPTKI